VAVKSYVFWNITLFSLVKCFGDVGLFSLNCTEFFSIAENITDLAIRACSMF
jgi:hypothetical protein